jgi:preprotein translocase subunit YajC
LETIVLISPAFAQIPGVAGESGWVGMLPIVLMFVLLYFLMIRPQMKRAKEHKAMTETLQKGDEVITAGGVLGKIAKVGEAYIAIEIAPGTEVQVQKSAVQTLLPKGTIKSI